MLEVIKKTVRDVPDFPKQGIVFKDITPVLNDPVLFRGLLDEFVKAHRGRGIQVVAGIESRGFILAAPLAVALGAGFVPIRKKGKLPAKVYREEFALEYGTDVIELHQDAFPRGARVLLVDDVLATGGTAVAAMKLLDTAGASLVGLSFMIELGFLGGRTKMPPCELHALIRY